MKILDIFKKLLFMRILTREEIEKIKEIGSKYGEVEETKGWIIIHPKGTKRQIIKIRDVIRNELKEEGIDVPVGFGYKYRDIVIPKEIRPVRITFHENMDTPYVVTICVEDTYKLKDELKNRGFYYKGFRKWCIDVDPDLKIVNEIIDEVKKITEEKGLEYEVDDRNLNDVLNYALTMKRKYDTIKKRLIEKLELYDAINTVEALKNDELLIGRYGAIIKPRHYLGDRWYLINRELKLLGYRWDKLLGYWIKWKTEESEE